ncbi:hypothetical protein EJ08DRAFT_731016 [Tothia fuscella]|uniref:DUF952 domain-containing protein n=1 Tax=Tothia fuscella TaxID=1048955 RepID=A0A9P4U200_9PEZI|nr:hypothetical protein EJ08DRAFT_731016 [Tothia fuscella]
MSAPDPLPKYIYKILPSDPSPLTFLPLSDLDEGDGFIHLSTSSQVPSTADRFFVSATELWLLKIPYDKVENRIKWEGNSKAVFPHIYDDDLSKALGEEETESVIKCERKEGEQWSGALAKVFD